MMPRISSTASAAIASGVGARAKSAGVTSLTFSSVVWAESTTATSRVKGSRWSSGIGGLGVELVEDLHDPAGLFGALHDRDTSSLL